MARNSSPAKPAAGSRTGATGNDTIRVRATQTGYYADCRRREGDVFTVAVKDFSEKWMERVHPETREHTTTSQEALRREHDQIRQGAIAGAGAGLDTPSGADPLGES